MTEMTVEGLLAALAAGKTTSRAALEAALEKASDPAGEGARAYTRLYTAASRAAADAQDALRRAGVQGGPLAGVPISIKDLFDVQGETTLAGSRALDDAPPASADAPIVARLRAAGAVIVGKTNMTEFAYSGVGINPHFGTPGNPSDRTRIPGGSSSGAAVSAADGMCAAAIGTDTGGSVRIPAALCGLAGFKPTQARVPRDGAVPLSTTLDSIGPLGHSMADCAIVDAVLAGAPAIVPAVRPLRGLRLAVPQTLVLDDLDETVASVFERSCAALTAAGAEVTAIAFEELGEIAPPAIRGGFSFAEAYAWHEKLLVRRGADYDPYVRHRIELGKGMLAADYVRLIEHRRQLIARAYATMAPYDAIILPTVAIVAPPIAAFDDLATYTRLNMLILRNSAPFNFLDCCAATLPVHRHGDAPVGMMVVGPHGADQTILGVSRSIEAALSSSR